MPCACRAAHGTRQPLGPTQANNASTHLDGSNQQADHQERCRRAQHSRCQHRNGVRMGLDLVAAPPSRGVIFAGNPTLLLSLSISRDRVIFGGSFLAGTPRRFTCFRHRCFRGRLEGPPARAVKVCVRAAGRPNARVGQGLVCAGHVPRGRSRSDRVRPERGTDGTVALSVAFDSEERAQERTPRAARDANEPEI